MGCCGKFLVKVFAFLLNLFKLGGAIAIICIVAIHLVNVEFYEIFEYECLLGEPLKQGAGREEETEEGLGTLGHTQSHSVTLGRAKPSDSCCHSRALRTTL